MTTTSLIVGLGKTGLSCARFLRKHGVAFAIADNRMNPPGLAEFQREFPNVLVHLGPWQLSVFLNAHQLIVSPGVSLRIEPITKAIQKGIEVIGDIELFARHVPSRVIAITGSNAKSTVTTLVGELLQGVGFKVAVGGNLGICALDLLSIRPVPDYFILELSSFQLESTFSLVPHVATILNISPDHLDRYSTLAEYVAAKQRIYRNSYFQVVNRHDPLTYPHQARKLFSFGLSIPVGLQNAKLGAEFTRDLNFLDPKNSKEYLGYFESFSGQENLKVDVKSDAQLGILKSDRYISEAPNFGLRHVEGDVMLCLGDKPLLSAQDLFIKGEHNYLNALAALAICYALGIEINAVLPALKKFRGLPHRCEFVREKDGVCWYNDSKGTNVGATVAALCGLGSATAGKLIWIAGGVGKNADFSPLQSPVKHYVRTAILMGQDAELIGKALGSTVAVSYADSLQAAVSLANQAAQPGDKVLLSPACASFDMFDHFEQRGDIFKEWVYRL